MVNFVLRVLYGERERERGAGGERERERKKGDLSVQKPGLAMQEPSALTAPAHKR